MAPRRTDDQAAAADAGGDTSTVLTTTGETEPNPAVAADAAVPYDIGGLPPAPGSETRAVWVPQAEGEVGVALDGGPRQAFDVKNHVVQAPANLAARIASGIPGARLED